MNLIIDVDGVVTDGKMIYSKDGKEYKTFGPDDTDSLDWLKEQWPDLNIVFVSADKRGFEISKKRVEDMGFKIEYMPSKHRWQYMQQYGYKLDETIYIGDGWHDGETFDNILYSLCPYDSWLYSRNKADVVLRNSGGERCVAEACIEIDAFLRKIYGNQ